MSPTHTELLLRCAFGPGDVPPNEGLRAGLERAALDRRGRRPFAPGLVVDAERVVAWWRDVRAFQAAHPDSQGPLVNPRSRDEMKRLRSRAQALLGEMEHTSHMVGRWLGEAIVRAEGGTVGPEEGEAAWAALDGRLRALVTLADKVAGRTFRRGMPSPYPHNLGLRAARAFELHGERAYKTADGRFELFLRAILEAAGERPPPADMRRFVARLVDAHRRDAALARRLYRTRPRPLFP